LIVQILAVVLILFFCFVTYMNTKTWRATHVTFMFLVFGAAITFSVYAALTLKTRRAWQKAVADLDKKLVTQLDQNETLLYGSKDSPKTVAGVTDWQVALDLAIVDRGRVWRDCTFTGSDLENPNPETNDATVVAKLSTIPPGNTGEKVPPNGMPKDTIVYAFKDMNAATAPHTNYLYVGEFRATSVSDTAITLTSTWPLTQQEQGWVPGNQPWVLYERMPVDSQQVFSHGKSLFVPEVKPGEVLKAETFPDAAAFPLVLAEYERDGMTLEEVNKDRAAKGQKPLSPVEEQERMYAEVKFLKDYTVKVDAPEVASPAAGPTEFFDGSGQALDPRVRRGSDISFKAGDTGIMILHGHRGEGFVERGATELAEEGIVEIQRTIYRRPLHDYAYAFAHLHFRRNQIIDETRLVNYELNVLKQEIADATANTKARQGERAKLVEDQGKLKTEREKITQYVADLEASYRDVRNELSRLYRENAALHDRIVAANDKLTREIEARGSTAAVER
jgi:hypothetical protein